MTKKQKRLQSEVRRSIAAQINILNSFPVRYRNVYDAVLGANGIDVGKPGYDKAPFEQRFVATC